MNKIQVHIAKELVWIKDMCRPVILLITKNYFIIILGIKDSKLNSHNEIAIEEKKQHFCIDWILGRALLSFCTESHSAISDFTPNFLLWKTRFWFLLKPHTSLFPSTSWHVLNTFLVKPKISTFIFVTVSVGRCRTQSGPWCIFFSCTVSPPTSTARWCSFICTLYLDHTWPELTCHGHSIKWAHNLPQVKTIWQLSSFPFPKEFFLKANSRLLPVCSQGLLHTSYPPISLAHLPDPLFLSVHC